jgi:hypothetical protein
LIAACKWARTAVPVSRHGPTGTSTAYLEATVTHSISETLALIDSVRALAFDRSLTDAEGMMRIRDAFRDHDDTATPDIED